MDTKKWYVIYTKPQWERKIHEKLERWYGIEAWCPLIKSRRKWSDRVKVLEVPLFRSYVFVKVTEKERVQALTIDGALYCVRYLGKPAVIRDADIDELKQFLEEYTEVKLQVLEPGNRVVIREGIFEGQSGIVKRVLDNNKVVLEMPQLGCQLEASRDVL